MMLHELLSTLLLGAMTCTTATASDFMTRSQMEFNSQDAAVQFTQEYEYYKNTGVRSAILIHFYETLRIPPFIGIGEYMNFGVVNQALDHAFTNTACLLCAISTHLLFDYRRRLNSSTEFMKSVAKDLCYSFNVQTLAVCDGAIGSTLEVVLFVIDNNLKLDTDMMCGVVLKGYGCSTDHPLFEWTVSIDDNKPRMEEPPDQRKYDDGDILHIVHIGDLHVDPKYIAGGNANCDEPTCCRSSQGPPASSKHAAGKWADYKQCDLPWSTVEDLVSTIKKQHDKIDVIYFTGDIIDHVIWETSIEQNTKIIRDVFALFKRTFGDVPVFPILGNHEAHPLNAFSPKEITGIYSTQWLYDFVAHEWGKWLPESTIETIKKGGYYTTLIRPGFRVIGLNNNDCYVLNWWLMYDPAFPAEQLNWLADTLLKAEEANEKVHILVHRPPGDSESFQTCSREYHKIVNRFSQIIKAQFNGHTHLDEWEIFYDRENPAIANNVAWNGGSVTPYENVNPNYKVYQVHPDNYDLLDYESWTFNVTEANLHPDLNPTWYKLYSFKDTYGVPDLTPKSLDLLAQNMVKNPDLLRRYWALKGKTGDPWLKEGCDQKCLDGHLCEMLTSNSEDHSKCDEYFLPWRESTNTKKYFLSKNTSNRVC